MVKEDGGYRGPGTEQCLLAPYVPTAHLSLLLRPSDPELLGCRFWGLGLAIKFTTSSASQERGGRRRRRGFQKSRMTGLCREEAGIRNFRGGETQGNCLPNLPWSPLLLLGVIYPSNLQPSTWQPKRQALTSLWWEWAMSSLILLPRFNKTNKQAKKQTKKSKKQNTFWLLKQYISTGETVERTEHCLLPIL